MIAEPKFEGKTAIGSTMGIDVAFAGVIGGRKESLNSTEVQLETAAENFQAMLETAQRGGQIFNGFGALLVISR